jgi:hypothetical protein
MILGQIQLRSPYVAGSGSLYTNDLTAVLAQMDAVPSRATVYQRANLGVSTTYAVTAAAGSSITLGSVIAGTDRAYSVGDLVSFQCSLADVSGGAGTGTIQSGTAGQLTGYAASGTTVSGVSVGSSLALAGTTLNAVVPMVATFSLAPGTSMQAGTNPFGPWIAPYAGTIQKWKAIAETNPSTGGFTFDLQKNGSSIFASPPSVAASTTTVQAGSSFAATAVAEGDLIRCNLSAVGTGVQSAKIILIMIKS